MNHDIERPFVNPSPERVKAFIDQIPLYRNDDDPTFWSADRLQQRRSELLNRQVGWLEQASPYYQRKFKEWGISSADIRSIDDLARIPVTTKDDLMADPGSFRLRFEQPTIYDHTYATVYTTGTTRGQPTPYEYTSHDYLGVMLAGRRSHKLHYGIPGDKILSLFPLSPLPHVAMFASSIANAAGILYNSGMTGTTYSEFPVHRSSTSVLDQIENLKPQILVGISSYVRHLLTEAAKQGRDLSSIYLLEVSGESTTHSMREKMRDSLAACGVDSVFICSTYGFTEGGISWAPCHETSSLHCVAPDQMILEVLDPETHEPMPDGESGLVAISHLDRRGMPLLRYLLGDIGTLARERCPYCGRGGESLIISCGSAHITRTNDLVKIKGVLVNPECIHEVVMNIPEIQEYQLLLDNRIPGDPDSGDRLILKLGLDPAHPLPDQHLPVFMENLAQQVFYASEVTPEVSVIDDPLSIYDPERDFKVRRLIDRRALRG